MMDYEQVNVAECPNSADPLSVMDRCPWSPFQCSDHSFAVMGLYPLLDPSFDHHQ